MPMRRAEFWSLLLAACLLTGVAHAGNPCEAKRWNGRAVLALNQGGTEDYGIGGTGHGPEDYGIGGTGHGPEDYGIGGTGHAGEGIGGTGIVGVVAGFASICVNGLEIHYSAATPTLLDGVRARPEILALGQIVAVGATELGDGEYRAESISILNAVVGEVESVTGESLKLLGQQVRLDVSEGIRPGMRLAVAGERLADGTIQATRVAPAAADAADSVLGVADQVEPGRFFLGGLEVRVDPERTPVPGEEVLVRGRLRDGVLRGEQVIQRPLRDFPRTGKHLELPQDALTPGARDPGLVRAPAAVTRPEMPMPEVMRPEVSRPEIPRALFERPLMDRPERPRGGR